MVAAATIELRSQGDFVEWLAATGGALAVTTYNSGKLAFFSAPNGNLVASAWAFPRPMGLAVANDGRMALAARDHLWVFQTPTIKERNGSMAEPRLRCETVYATGRLDVHDVAFDSRGLLFANTRFNCLARPSEKVSFIRSWQPSFITTTAGADGCHLNGVGVRRGRLEMATAFCESDAPGAWREGDRFQSGVLIDVVHNRVAARGLCPPHSPRWHNGRWWLCDSGRGTLLTFDAEYESCRVAAALPGFTRGLTFVADRAVVGLSRIRKRHILDAPPVRQRWARLRSGVALVDPASGAETGSLEFVRGGREVYDVAFLPDVTATVRKS